MTRAVSAGPLTGPQPSTAPIAKGILVSVNVGLPRDVEWRGRTVHTGVWKHPVDGPHQVRALNIDGDGQGDLSPVTVDRTGLCWSTSSIPTSTGVANSPVTI